MGSVRQRKGSSFHFQPYVFFQCLRVEILFDNLMKRQAFPVNEIRDL